MATTETKQAQPIVIRAGFKVVSAGKSKAQILDHTGNGTVTRHLQRNKRNGEWTDNSGRIFVL